MADMERMVETITLPVATLLAFMQRAAERAVRNAPDRDDWGAEPFDIEAEVTQAYGDLMADHYEGWIHNPEPDKVPAGAARQCRAIKYVEAPAGVAVVRCRKEGEFHEGRHE